MKTRTSVLFSSVIALLFTFSSIARADPERDNSLKDIAITATLISWFLTYQNNKNPITETFQLADNHHRIGFSQGKDQFNRFQQLYYGRDLKNTLIKNQYLKLKGHWEFGINTWNSSVKNAEQPQGVILRAIPVYSIEPVSSSNVTPYTEFGIGINLLSSSTIANTQKSSQFHFVQYLGAGVRIDQFQIGYRFAHISNAGINLPNPATDIHSLNVSYLFFTP